MDESRLTPIPTDPGSRQRSRTPSYSKRAALSEIQEPSHPKKHRHSSFLKFDDKNFLSPPKKRRSPDVDEEAIFAGKGVNVQNIETFDYPGTNYMDEELGGKGDFVPPQELEWLISSIPLEDRANGAADMNEMVMVYPANGLCRRR
jgi:hypothetical protein